MAFGKKRGNKKGQQEEQDIWQEYSYDEDSSYSSFSDSNYDNDFDNGFNEDFDSGEEKKKKKGRKEKGKKKEQSFLPIAIAGFSSLAVCICLVFLLAFGESIFQVGQKSISTVQKETGQELTSLWAENNSKDDAASDPQVFDNATAAQTQVAPETSATSAQNQASDIVDTYGETETEVWRYWPEPAQTNSSGQQQSPAQTEISAVPENRFPETAAPTETVTVETDGISIQAEPDVTAGESGTDSGTANQDPMAGSYVPTENDQIYWYGAEEVSEEKILQKTILYIDYTFSDGSGSVLGHTDFYGHDDFISLDDVYMVSSYDYTIQIGDTCFVANEYDQGIALRDSPNKEGYLYCRIPFGTPLVLEDYADGWGYFSYNGYSGWMDMNYVAGNFPDLVYIVETDASYGMNLRQEPSSSSNSLCYIPNGKALVITSFENGWGATDYQGIPGYVSISCLKPYARRETVA